MITEFGIGNFQAFGELQRVPLKPITLIFGPNSAGKSALTRSLLVAQHAIINGKLSKSEGAGERHPGAFTDMVRNGSTGPISFEFTVQPDRENEDLLKLGVSWKETHTGEFEVVSVSLNKENSDVVSYTNKGSLKHLEVKSLDIHLYELMNTARWEIDQGDVMDDQTHPAIKRRLALCKNTALPGSDADHFRIAERQNDQSDILDFSRTLKEDRETNELLVSWIQRIEACVVLLKSAITKEFKPINSCVKDELTKLIYHGPIRPICDEITTAKKTEPGVVEWWNLAADPKLLTKVNAWLERDVFKTKYRLEFDRLFPDSALRQLLHSLSREWDINELCDAAFEYKFENDEKFRESQIDLVVDWFLVNPVSDHTKEDQRQREARDNSCDAILSETRSRGIDYYECLYAESNTEEIESFFIGGLKQILTSLHGNLESVRQVKKTTDGGFDSAKVRFIDSVSTKGVAPSNMGIGFSQMMPLVASAFGAECRLIAIEQPELHIHPALQTELADLFIQSATERNNRFLIETHSEHLILRVLRRIRETTRGTLPEGKSPIRREDVAVLYVQPSPEGSKVIEMHIDDQGRLVDNWPNGFFEERLDELF